MRRKYITKLVREVLDEMSTTGAVGGYQTPNAFSKSNKDNLATKYAKRIGYKKVKTKKDKDK